MMRTHFAPSGQASRQRGRGLTLIELMVTVGILGIVLATAAPSLADFMNKRRVRLVADELSTLMVYARSEAGLRNRRVNVVFNSGSSPSCYTIAEFGALGRCNCSSTPICTGSAIELKTVTIPGLTGVNLTPSEALSFNTGQAGVKGYSMGFMVPSLRADPSNVSVDVGSARGYQLRMQLSPLGRPSLCTPNGSYSDVPRCEAPSMES
jgi:type IV fimbrial biogenesis protein FimT